MNKNWIKSAKDVLKAAYVFKELRQSLSADCQKLGISASDTAKWIKERDRREEELLRVIKSY